MVESVSPDRPEKPRDSNLLKRHEIDRDVFPDKTPRVSLFCTRFWRYTKYDPHLQTVEDSRSYPPTRCKL